ncbi:GspE/PulE family protein [Oceanicaulis sp. HTCC2633]|uniref:GspE/PulE family protein n=1 Tax=Oceanicaulis sp. HTCC2633 TaxID=314254 RepID=UPI0002FC27B9|nr:GspE/PulE family protein [Oceanicaulis sp. HTCC2633]
MGDHLTYDAVCSWLSERGLVSAISEDMVAKAMATRGEPRPLVLNRLGALDDGELQSAFSTLTGLPLAKPQVSESALALVEERRVSKAFLRARRALLLDCDEDWAEIGLVDPLDDAAISGLRFALGREMRIGVLKAGDQRRLHSQLFEEGGEGWQLENSDRADDALRNALEFDRDAPVARRVADWLMRAVEARASDVHIEPRPNALTVRYRIDGVLHTVAMERLEAANAVMARVKVLADLDLGERRAPQDGRTTVVVAGRPIDIRVSIVPSVHGEAAVMRILDRGGVELDFNKLGFSPRQLDLLNGAIEWPHGLFLVTGPTGSGKTTTLYAALEALHRDDRKIITVEDPVEFHFEHVTQVQTAPKAGVTFASAIRAFLRQDPDVILVGEIRDGETAATAIQAALTGHLVLATLHTIDASRAVPRLLDMGVEAFQLSACLRGVVAQRLVRRLCPECKTESQATASEAAALGLEAGEAVFEGKGCAYCSETGYQGRIVIAEAFQANEDFAQSIRQHEDLSAHAKRLMPNSLIEDGVLKVRTGQTSPTELMRVLSS